MLKERDSKIEE